MKYIYAVLGGGRQGTAASYDMAKYGDAKAVRIADADPAAAGACAERVNRMLRTDVAHAVELDVTDERALEAFLAGVDSFLSAVPYWLNPKITEVAIRERASMCDLGGKTDLVLDQLKLDGAAAAAGISVVPDCGQVPGMGTSLTVYAISLLDRTEHVFM